MVIDSRADGGSAPAGPTLYLSEGDGEETFCPLVFDDATENDYRVVQLTSNHSFSSLQQALDVQLSDLPDPSEAAAVMLSPKMRDTEVVAAEVGARTKMFGFRIDPEDLTGVSIAFSKLVNRWEATTGSMEVCLRGIESLFPYHDPDLLYRFLNTILATLQGAGADVHMHLDPEMTDERTSGMFMSLFTQVEKLETTGPPTSDSRVPATDEGPDTAPTDTSDSSIDFTSDAAEQTVEMSRAEIDAFLEEKGLGILAFAGDPPYAIPMSFGFDANRRELYLQLGLFEGSEKRARIRESPSVSLVVDHYDRPDKWRSVIVDGELSTLSQETVQERGVIATFAKSELASVDVFSMDPGEVDFSWYLLEPTEFSGRKGASQV